MYVLILPKPCLFVQCIGLNISVVGDLSKILSPARTANLCRHTLTKPAGKVLKFKVGKLFAARQNHKGQLAVSTGCILPSRLDRTRRHETKARRAPKRRPFSRDSMSTKTRACITGSWGLPSASLFGSTLPFEAWQFGGAAFRYHQKGRTKACRHDADSSFLTPQSLYPGPAHRLWQRTCLAGSSLTSISQVTRKHVFLEKISNSHSHRPFNILQHP